jgi:hypothetical protein
LTFGSYSRRSWAVNGPAKLAERRERLDRRTVAGWVIDHRPITFALSLVHGGVGVLEQCRRVATMVWEQGDADARGCLEGQVGKPKRLSEPLIDTLRYGEGSAGNRTGPVDQ